MKPRMNAIQAHGGKRKPKAGNCINSQGTKDMSYRKGGKQAVAGTPEPRKDESKVVQSSRRVKVAGRKKGTPNRITSDVREMIRVAVEGEFQHLPETLAGMPEAERLEIVCKLLKFIVPQLQAVAVADVQNPDEKSRERQCMIIGDKRIFFD